MQRLDKLTQGEALMAATQNLRATNAVNNKVTQVGNEVQAVGEKVQDVDNKVTEIGEKSVSGGQITFKQSFITPSQISICSGVEKLRQQIAKEFGDSDSSSSRDLTW